MSNTSPNVVVSMALQRSPLRTTPDGVLLIALVERPTALEVKSAGDMIARFDAIEQLAAGSIAARRLNTTDQPATGRRPAAIRLEAAVAAWEIQTHRTLANNPEPADLVRVARVQALIATTTVVVSEAAAGQGEMDAGWQQTHPGLENAQPAWSRSARRWAELTTHASRTDPALVEAASQLRAEIRTAVANQTGWATAEQIASRIDLPATVMTFHRSLVAAVELANVTREIAADHPSLAAPAARHPTLTRPGRRLGGFSAAAALLSGGRDQPLQQTLLDGGGFSRCSRPSLESGRHQPLQQTLLNFRGGFSRCSRPTLDGGRPLLLTGVGANHDYRSGDRRDGPLQHLKLPLRIGHVRRRRLGRLGTRLDGNVGSLRHLPPQHPAVRGDPERRGGQYGLGHRHRGHALLRRHPVPVAEELADRPDDMRTDGGRVDRCPGIPAGVGHPPGGAVPVGLPGGPV
jgi:hypothetical protein